MTTKKVVEVGPYSNSPLSIWYPSSPTVQARRGALSSIPMVLVHTTFVIIAHCPMG